MPQPFNYTSRPEFNPDAAKNRAAIATLIAEHISLFSRTEFYQLSILSKLIGADSYAFMMYASITNEGARGVAAQAVENAVLDDAKREKLIDLRKEITSCRKFRNKLAHWIYGLAPTEPDKLLIVDPCEFVKWYRSAADGEPSTSMKIFTIDENEVTAEIETCNNLNRRLMIFQTSS